MIGMIVCFDLYGTCEIRISRFALKTLVFNNIEAAAFFIFIYQLLSFLFKNELMPGLSFAEVFGF